MGTVLTRALFAVAMACCLGAAVAAETRLIRPSDVVFMYDNPKLYADYGCTALGWAGWGRAEHIAAAHAAGVRVFAVSVGFRTEAARMIDFTPDFLDAACRNLAGEPFVVPWLWDHKHKGQPSWHFCTNSPLFRKYLESRLAELAKTPYDCLHIDDYSGTSGPVQWGTGCFCPSCMAEFRKYLASAAAKAKLAELGIADLAKFDYRQFLLDRGAVPADYNKQRYKLPLYKEFLDFQVRAANDYVAVYRRKAEELAGRKLGLCVNSGLGDPATLVIAPHLTHFCCEVEHHAAKRAVPLHPLWVYKLADGLDRPVTSTAGGWDWAFAAEHKLYGLVRTWIALSYACGHNFMAPQRQWCYTKEKGTHWWETPAVEFAPLYQFVRRHAVLLDGYAAAAQVAVVYDNAARRQGRPTIEPICTALAERNVPFTVVVAGDDWLDYRLDAARLKPFRAVIVAGEPLCDEAQRRVLDSAKSEGRLITWPDQAALEKLVPPQVVVEGDPPVHVQVRVRPQEPTAPAVVHLLNRQYDAAKDAMTVQKQIKVRVRRELLGGRQPARAVLHAPAGEDRNLDLTSDEQSVMFTVPELELWAIVELAGGSQ